MWGKQETPLINVKFIIKLVFMTRVLAKTSILTLEVRNQHKVLEGKIMEIEDKSLKNKE